MTNFSYLFEMFFYDLLKAKFRLLLKFCHFQILLPPLHQNASQFQFWATEVLLKVYSKADLEIISQKESYLKNQNPPVVPLLTSAFLTNFQAVHHFKCKQPA